MSGVVNEVVLDSKYPRCCYLLFKKRRNGKPHEVPIKCYTDQVRRLGVKKNVTVYVQYVIQSKRVFDKFYIDLVAEKISLKEFEENPNYVKIARMKKSEHFTDQELDFSSPQSNVPLSEEKREDIEQYQDMDEDEEDIERRNDSDEREH